MIGEEKSKTGVKNIADDLVLTIDKNNNIIRVNRKCEKLSGHPQNQILNNPFFDLLIPESYTGQWRLTLEKIKRNEISQDFKLPLLTKDKRIIMIQWTFFPVKDTGDIGLVGKIIEDISFNDEQIKDIGIKEDFQIDQNYFNEFEKVVKQLERKNNLLEKKNSRLEQKIKDIKRKDKQEQDIIGKNLYQFSNVFGSRKKNQEFKVKMSDLDEREKYLNKLEKKLTQEKDKLDDKKNELIEWRKKLEILESEVQSRIKWVENKEKALDSFEKENNPSKLSKINNMNVEKYKTGTINNMDDCAAVVQRGVFKEVNSNLAELLGYKVSDIVEKSVFDFISPSGFGGIENYYLNRLKGDDISDFNTIFLTKDNESINVNIKTDTTIFNDEKAEIIIIKRED